MLFFLSSDWRLVLQHVEAERVARCLSWLLFNPSRILDQSGEIGLRSIGLASQWIRGELAANA